MENASANLQQQVPVRGSFNGSLTSWLRVFILIIAVVAVLVIGWTALGVIGHIIFLFFASLLFSYLIGPIVDRWSRHMRRGAAIGLVFLIVLPLAGLLLFLFIGPIIAELRNVAVGLSGPSQAQTEAITKISNYLNENGVSVDVNNLISQLAQLIKDASDILLNFIVGLVGHVVFLVTDVLMILAITFFLSVDGRGLNVRVLRLIPDSIREHALFIEATVSRVIGGYIRAQIIIATIYGTLAGVGSWVLGVDHAAFIGIAAFFLEFLPLVGPVISMGIAIVISLFQPLPLVVFVAIYFIFIQQLESNVLEPKIGGKILGLHAVVVIVSVLAGAAIAGILGAFLALPIVAASTTIALALYLDIRGRTSLLIPRRRRPAAESAGAVVSATPAQQSEGEAGPSPGAIAAASSNGSSNLGSPDIMEGAPPAALMFKDRLDFVLEEKARLQASYNEISAKQSAVERRAHGLEPTAAQISP